MFGLFKDTCRSARRVAHKRIGSTNDPTTRIGPIEETIDAVANGTVAGFG
jgi:hypothetical protein